MANNINKQQKGAKPPRKLFLDSWFTDAPVKVEPKEEQKVVIAGLAEAQIVKEYPNNYFGRAWQVFKGEFSTLLKSSLWFILFTLPFLLIIVVASGYFESYVLENSYNFMGNIGIGYPGGGDNISYAVANLIWKVRQPLLMMLGGAGVIASFGMAGIFYTAKRSYFQNYYKKTIKTYWMGFAKYWWKFAITSLFGILIAVAMGTALLNLLSQQSLGLASAGDYCGVVFSFILGLPMLLIPMVMQSIFVSYDLTFVQAFKNAIVLIVNCPLVVIIAGVVSSAPLLVLIAGNIAAIIVYIVMALAGFMFITLMWTAMGKKCTEKCSYIHKANEKLTVKAKKKEAKIVSSVSKAKPENANNAQVVKKVQTNKPYQNPKKKKKK